MASIRIENLSKIFGSRSAIEKAKKMLSEGRSKEEIVKVTGATVGVNNANLDIKEGETFVVMGLSGSGKSTMLRMLNRLIEPTLGDVYIDDQNVTKASKEELRDIRRNKVNMVFQNFGLFPHKTILENTEYGLEIKGADKEERRQAAIKALENAGLGAYVDQYPDQLSGGMQQRVGLARALANDAEIILMDEAFSALDPLIRRDMQDELVELQESMNKTIVFITHDLDEALRIGDRIALMKDGEVVQVGTGEDILQNPANGYVERFVENVDRSKILTAEHAMRRPNVVLNSEKDGARMALRRMQQEDYSFIMVTDSKHHLQGYVREVDVIRLIQENEGTKRINIDSILRTDMPVVQLETTINEIFEIITDAFMPVSVVDEDNRLRGMVSPKMLVNSLANEGENND